MAFVIGIVDYYEKRRLEKAGYKVEQAPESFSTEEDEKELFSESVPEKERMYYAMIFVDRDVDELVLSKLDEYLLDDSIIDISV